MEQKYTNSHDLVVNLIAGGAGIVLALLVLLIQLIDFDMLLEYLKFM